MRGDPRVKWQFSTQELRWDRDSGGPLDELATEDIVEIPGESASGCGRKPVRHRVDHIHIWNPLSEKERQTPELGGVEDRDVIGSQQSVLTFPRRVTNHGVAMPCRFGRGGWRPREDHYVPTSAGSPSSRVTTSRSIPRTTGEKCSVSARICAPGAYRCSERMPRRSTHLLIGRTRRHRRINMVKVTPRDCTARRCFVFLAIPTADRTPG